MIKPLLDTSAPIGVTLCSCGGGVDTGMIMAGIRPVAGVELDPRNPELSYMYEHVQRINFSRYGHQLQVKSIQQAQADEWKGIPVNPFVLHGSPPCINYSSLNSLKKGKKGEQAVDIEIGLAHADAIARLAPKYFTLECTSQYIKGIAWECIKKALIDAKYTIKYAVLDMADYGVPSHRERLFVFASSPGVPALFLPPKLPHIGWRQIIEDCERPDATLTDRQLAAVKEYSVNSMAEDLLVEKLVVAGDRNSQVKEGSEPCWTIIKSTFRDDKGASRNSVLTASIGGKWKSLTIRDVARLCGFPDWYAMPSDFASAGSIMGNAVPPSFYAYFWESNLNSF